MNIITAEHYYKKCREYYQNIEHAEKLFIQIEKILMEYPDYKGNKTFTELLNIIEKV